MVKLQRSYRFSPETLDDIEFAQNELGFSATRVIENSVPHFVNELTALLKLKTGLDRRRLAEYFALLDAAQKMLLAKVSMSEWDEYMIERMLTFGFQIALHNAEDKEDAEKRVLELTQQMRTRLDEFDAKVKSGELSRS